MAAENNPERSTEEQTFAARLACIQEAARKDYDLASPAVAGWLRIGVEKLRAGEEITPEVLAEIDRSQNSATPQPLLTNPLAEMGLDWPDFL